MMADASIHMNRKESGNLHLERGKRYGDDAGLGSLHQDD